MPATIAIGKQNFGDIRRKGCFYVDKTDFIREWWENNDEVTLVNRPRRFGKTLTMNMVEHFFSIEHKDDSVLFEGLNIWNDERYRNLQGTYPIISLSFAPIKSDTYQQALKCINLLITELYNKNIFLMESGILTDNEKEFYKSVNQDMDEADAIISLNKMSNFLNRYYNKKVIILLDEYDTPMHEAYVSGYWEETSKFFRSLFNFTLKTNPYMERALITGITRISKESMFSDLNNPKVITTTSEEYATTFGFTQDEVFAAMDEYGFTDKQGMKRWYDGFTFGGVSDIYNPWSVINALRSRRFAPYWVNTSSNALLNNVVRRGSAELKMQFEELLKGESIACFIDEEIVFDQLYTNKDAVWSLMLASGYLKVEKVEYVGKLNRQRLTLSPTNLEVEGMLNSIVDGWFNTDDSNYNNFIKALLLDDVDYMNKFMNNIALNSFSSFDTAKNSSSDDAPERFYHGFVLGLIVELDGRYEIKSNRESGFGRYDVMLKPTDLENDKAYIIEFKVRKPQSEKTLEDTLRNALTQINEKHYEQELVTVGIPSANIRKYGFAFEGKKVLIG
jgi:hypothetical protein